MPKGKGYSTSGRAGRKSQGGYPGRGAAGMPNNSSAKKARAEGYTGGKEGTLAGGNTNVMKSDEYRDDMTAGITHSNPYPKGMGGGSGPGRS